MDITKNRFYAGTTRGLLLYTGDKPNDLNVSKTDESSEVTSMCNGRTAEEIILGYKNGHVTLFDSSLNKYTKTVSKLEGDGSIVGVGCVDNAIIAAKHDGVINMIAGKKKDYFSINLDEKGTLDAVMCNSSRSVIGTGGEFNDFKLWDIEKKQCIFKAKSMGHDELQLPIPTSVRSIAFCSNQPTLATCATKEGYVLLYDERAQRRPVVKFLEKKASYTTIATAFRDRQCFVGTTKGYIQWLDMKVGKCLKTYTAFTGGITSIVCDPVEPYIASICLDRFLRVHNVETKELIYKLYMKQSLSALVVKPIVKDENDEEIDKEKDKQNVDEEYEEMFKNMEEIGGKKPPRKHKIQKSALVEMPKKKFKKIKSKSNVG